MWGTILSCYALEYSECILSKVAESVEINSKYYSDNGYLLKASEELLKISKFNGLDDEDLKNFSLNCNSQLSEEQSLTFDYLDKWGDKLGLWN